VDIDGESRKCVQHLTWYDDVDPTDPAYSPLHSWQSRWSPPAVRVPRIGGVAGADLTFPPKGLGAVSMLSWGMGGVVGGRGGTRAVAEGLCWGVGHARIRL